MPDSKKSLANQLLKWFDRDQREMPWRKNKDPYRIWVSEIMLQQTQVKTVIPYFNRWMKTFPSVHALAKAPITKVLKQWEGLGYYSRARNLHKAAKIVSQELKGKVPDTLPEVLKLPGIGRYTAGAILSIAFDQPVPVLDGNVKRVVSRLFKMKDNGATTASETRLWNKAESLVPKNRPGDFNQALMELGATVCLPKKPMCLICPLNKTCEAFAGGQQDKYPPLKKRTPSKKIEVSAGVIQRRGKTYIQQRPHGGLMGGLWEFPGGKIEPGETPEQCLIRELKEELGVKVAVGEKLLTIRHSYTQFRVTLHVYDCKLEKGRIKATQCDDWKWVSPSALKEYPFPAANVKIVNLLSGNGKKPR